jgi:monofunctional glycosyltransferase
VRGGSTISQQTAKNAFLWPGRSYIRKGLEAWFTVLIELIWGKPRIMEVYLNIAEMGPGVYGVEAAAQHYFNTSAAQLSPAQAARIAAILPQPIKRDAARPGRFVKRYANRIERRARVVRNEGIDACLH